MGHLPYIGRPPKSQIFRPPPVRIFKTTPFPGRADFQQLLRVQIEPTQIHCY